MNLIVNYSLSSIIIFIRFIIDFFMNINEKRRKTIHDILDINIYIIKLYLFYNTITNNISFKEEFILNNTQNKEISQVLVYNNFDYGINLALYLYQKDYESIYHHLITISCISICDIYHYHNITIITMFLFILSSPVLSFAKICRANDYKELSELAFITFASVFFICRIVIFTYFLYISIFNEYYNTYQYYLINGCELLIYNMQLNWMYKILKIIMDNKK